MYTLLNDGGHVNTPIKEYYVETEAEVAEIKDAPIGSTVLILNADGLKVKMLRSTGWVDV
jgi:hypothetical protein